MSAPSPPPAAPPARARIDLRRVLALARPQLRRLVLGTIALTISAGMSLAYPWYVKEIVDGVLAGQGRAALDGVVVALLGLFFVGSVMGALRAWWFTVAGERIVSDLRRDLYAAIVRQDIAFFDERRTGELTNRLAADAAVLQNTVTVNVSMALRYLVMGLGALGILFWTSWKLTLLMLAVVPLVVVGATLYGRVLRDISRSFQDALAQATTVAEETIAGIRTVRAFAHEPAERARYGKAVEDSFALAVRRARVGAVFRGVAGFFGYAAIAAVLWYGGLLLTRGQMSMGELTSFLLYTFTLAFSLGALSSLWEDFMKAVGASERVFELLDRQPQVAGGHGRLERVQGRVAFSEVGFAYPARADRVVLDGLSMSLEPGTVTALVGPSGAGKSTVAALLSRFYDPQRGQITLDGQDLRALDPDWLRGQVGVVSQEPVLFACSVAENIRYGRQDATDAEVEAAARAANAHDFIAALPDGYDTPVGERGMKLSGGERQRISLARAFLKNAPILILDEPTSSVDVTTEGLIMDALERLMQGRTTFIIAHRLSTLEGCDLRLRLEAGRLSAGLARRTVTAGS